MSLIKNSQFAKDGIHVTYSDDSTQNLSFVDKKLTIDQGLVVSSGGLNATGVAQITGTLGVSGAASLANNLAVAGTMTSTGAATMSNTLNVVGATALGSTLTVAGATNISGTLAVNGSTSVNQFTAVQDAHMSSTLDVAGATSLASTLAVTGAATMGSTLSVTGVSNLTGNIYAGAGLEVANDADLYGNVIVRQGFNAKAASLLDGAVTAGSTLDVTGSTTLRNALTVAGGATMNSGLTVNGTLTHTGASSVSGASSVGGSLTVTGAANMNSTLAVTGATSLDNTLAVTGAASLGNTLDVTGAASLGNTLDVTGAASLGSSLAVTGTASLGSSLAVTGAASLGNTLGVTGATSLGNTLDVTGASNLNNTLAVTGAASLNNTLAVSGAASLNDTLAVTGAASLGSSLAVTGTASLGSSLAVTGAASLGNTLDVTGAASLGSSLNVTGASNLNNTLAVSGAASLNDTLAVTGAASLGSSLAVTGTASLGSSLAVSGAASLGNTLAVSGAASLNNTLAVSGPASLNNTLEVSGAASLNNTLAVSGAASLSNTLAVTGAASLNNTLAVSGAASLNSTLDVTGAATFQNVTVHGNLNVLGTQTTIDTTSLQIKDNAVLLADGNTSDAIESGIMLQYQPSSSGQLNYAGIKRLPVTGEFVLFKDAANKIAEPLTPAEAAAAAAAAAAALAAAAAYSIAGNYIQIDTVGGPKILASYNLINGNGFGSPDNVYIVGSNDNGATWNLIHHQLSAVHNVQITTTGDHAGVAFSKIRFVIVNFQPAPAQVVNGHGFGTYSEWDITDNTGAFIPHTMTSQGNWPQPQQYHAAPSWSFNVWNSPGGYLYGYGEDNNYNGTGNYSTTIVPTQPASSTPATDVYADLKTGSINSVGTLNVVGNTSLNNTLAVTGATTMSSTLAVTGNTSVNGILSVQSLNVRDPIIVAGDGNTADLMDEGIAFAYHNGTSSKFAGLKRPSNTSDFVFFADAPNKAGNSVTTTAMVTSSSRSELGPGVRIDFPSAFVLTSYRIGCANAPYNAIASEFYIYGTNTNDSNVYLVYHQTSANTLNDYITTGATIAYSTYYVVVRGLTGTGSTATGSWNVGWMEFLNNGTSKIPSSASSFGLGAGANAFGGGAWAWVDMFSAIRNGLNGNGYHWCYFDSIDGTYQYFNSSFSNGLQTLTINNVTTVTNPSYANVIANAFNCASDMNLKKNVVTIEHALDKLDGIRGVYHDWVEESNNEHAIGVIAQEVQAVYPQLVHEGADGYLSVNYPKLTAVLLQAIKELKAIVLSK